MCRGCCGRRCCGLVGGGRSCSRVVAVLVIVKIVDNLVVVLVVAVSVVDPDPGIRIGSTFRSFLDPYSEYRSISTHVSIGYNGSKRCKIKGSVSLDCLPYFFA